jgi:hypothetical protein
MSEGTNKNMMPCPTCGEEIAKHAKVCPKCGAKIKKPWYKKWWVWVIAVVVVGGIAGSGKGEDDKTTPQVSTTAQNGTATADTADTANTADTADTATAEAPAEVQQEPVVLWDNNGLKVTYTGVEEDFMTMKLNVLIENNTDKDRTVSLESLDVNGYSIDSTLYSEVTAGKKKNDSISIFTSDLEKNGIKDLKDVDEVEIKLKSWNDTTYQTEESDVVTLSFGQ